ncbi:NUDIX domain-containing protein [Streptomyces pilosus]|uniref:NUDIX domain-containing protein n=1 Tax=Streptomyces pilosus TaxID=28893 RepID=UPI003632F8CA
MPAEQHAATRHAAWLGAAPIITDEVGQVLLVRPTYREDGLWVLLGGVVEHGEHPHVTCRREITAELGLDLPLSAVLAVHSFSAHHPDLQPGTHRPGEIRFVSDGGTLTPDQVEAIRLPHEELSEYAFLETRDAVQRLRPVDGQIMLAAYRARFGNTATAHLADGRHILDVPVLDRHDVHVRYRPMWDSPLHRGPVPERLPVRQAWAWCFIPDGPVVLVADPGPRGALPMLPGGTVESTDATPEDTLYAKPPRKPSSPWPTRCDWAGCWTRPARSTEGWGPTPGSAWPLRSPPSGRRPSTPRPDTPSSACSPPPPRLPPCWAGARPEPGRPNSLRTRHVSGGVCPPLPPLSSRRSLRRGCG